MLLFPQADGARDSFPVGEAQLLSFFFFFGRVSAPRDGETEKRLDLQQVQTYFDKA